uniref:Uncharacterized protein n=1 Tax=Oryza meridionalis TaxID=40149 RepID=A0A0E0F9S0_9ORYZ
RNIPSRCLLRYLRRRQEESRLNRGGAAIEQSREGNPGDVTKVVTSACAKSRLFVYGINKQLQCWLILGVNGRQQPTLWKLDAF